MLFRSRGVLEGHERPAPPHRGGEGDVEVAVLAGVGPGAAVLETEAPGAVDLALVGLDHALDLGLAPVDGDVDLLALLGLGQAPTLGVGVEVAELDLAVCAGPDDRADADEVGRLGVGTGLQRDACRCTGGLDAHQTDHHEQGRDEEGELLGVLLHDPSFKGS